MFPKKIDCSRFSKCGFPRGVTKFCSAISVSEALLARACFACGGLVTKKCKKPTSHIFVTRNHSRKSVIFMPVWLFFLIQKFLTSNISSTSSTSLCITRLDTNCPLGISCCHQHFSSQIKLGTSAASFSVEHLLRFFEFDLTFHASLKLFFSERFHPQGTWFSKKSVPYFWKWLLQWRDSRETFRCPWRKWFCSSCLILETSSLESMSRCHSFIFLTFSRQGCEKKNVKQFSVSWKNNVI